MIELSYVLKVAAAFLGAVAVRTAIKVTWKVKVQPKLKGARGESLVRRIIGKYRRIGGRPFNDILIPAKYGTSQLDHVLVSRAGLFCFETKDRSGIINGTEADYNWTQTFPNSDKLHKFQNPIRQNYGHEAALRQVLMDAGFRRDEVPIFSFVVFTDPNCTIPNIPFVMKPSSMKTHLDHLHKECEPIFTNEEVAAISAAIEKSLVKSHDARHQHVLRARLAAETAKDKEQGESVDYLIRSSNNLNLDLASKEYTVSAHQRTQVDRAKFTDKHAMLTIKNRTDSIEAFFENAKRRNDKEPVSPGGAFDYFLCPYTFKRFPAEQAMDFYRGLWVAYLTKNPALADYMKEHGTDTLGNSSRVNKVLTAYNEDKEGFVRSVRSTNWYQTVRQSSKQKGERQNTPAERKTSSRPRQQPSLEQQIKSAEGRGGTTHSIHTHARQCER